MINIQIKFQIWYLLKEKLVCEQRLFHQNSTYAPKELKFYPYQNLNIMEKISSREKSLEACFWLIIRKQLVKKHLNAWTL